VENEQAGKLFSMQKTTLNTNSSLMISSGNCNLIVYSFHLLFTAASFLCIAYRMLNYFYATSFVFPLPVTAIIIHRNQQLLL